MSLVSNIETARQLLEQLRGRVSGSVRQETLKADLLEGLARAGDALADAEGDLSARPAAAGVTENDPGRPSQRDTGVPEDMRKLHRTLQARSRSNQCMISATDELQYLRDVCRIVVEDCGHAMVWIGYAEEDEGKTVRPVAHSGFEEGYLETLNLTWADSERGRGPTGTAIRRGKPCVCANMQEDQEFAPWRKEAVKRGYASSVVLPLTSGGRAFGAVSIYAREPNAFSPEEVALLSELAQDLSFGIMSIRLRQAHAQSEELLHRSEERYRSIVELSPDAVFVNHNGRVAYVNPAGLELFGASRAEQLVGRSPFELFHPDYHAKMRERIATLVGGGTVPLTEARIVRQDGTFRDAEVAAALYDVQEGHAIQVVLRDVTARKQAEEQLARSLMDAQQRAGETEAVLAAMNDAVLVYDAGMKVARANPGFVPTYGFDPTGLNIGEIIDRTHCRHLDGGPLSLENQPTPRALRGEPTLNQQFRITRCDGQERVLETSSTPLRVGGRIVGTVTVWHDITERKRAEEALATERANLQSVFDAANFGMLLLDRHGVVKRLNETLSRWIGRDLSNGEQRQPGDLVGCIHALTSPAGCGHAEHCGLCAIRGAFGSALRGGQPVHNVETESTLLIDGSEVRLCLEISADPLVLDGEPHVVLGMSDITDRKRAEEALQREKNRLEAVMAALPVGVAITDARGGTIMANRMFEQIWGGEHPPTASVDDYTAYRAWWSDSGRPVQPGEWASARAIERGESVVGQLMEIQRFDSSRAFVINSASPVRDAAGKLAGSAVAIQDITELRNAQQALAESEARHRLLAETMLQGVVHQRADGTIIAMNPAAERILGKTREQFLGSNSAREEHHTIRGDGTPFPGLEHPAMVALRTGQTQRGVVMGVYNPQEAAYRWISLDAVPVCRTGEDHPAEVYAVFEDITERRQLEGVQAFLAQTGAGPQDAPFFDALARYLAQSLGMDFVCIDRLEGDGLTARTVSVWSDDHFEDNVTYALKDTPCGDVVGKTVCCFPASVSQFFPRDAVLQDLRAESYVGVTLWGHTGQPIGLIAVIGRQPLVNRPMAEAVLKLVSVRAAGELERLDAEAALRESEERYRSLFNGMTEGFALHEIILDEAGRPCDYRFIDLNPSFERLTGLKREDLIGRRMREALPDEDPAWIATYGSVALTGEPIHLENYSTVLQRWYEVFSYRPAPMQFAVIFMDVTERRKAQEALARREEGLRQALRLGRSFAFEWDVATDVVLSGAESADILGLAPAGAVQDTGADYFRRVHPDDLGAVEKAIQGLSPENDTYTAVYRVIRPDGTVVCLEEIARGTFDARGGLERLTGIAADVTERMRAQEALRQSHEELERRVDERTAELRETNEALQREMEARQRAKEVASRLAAIVSSSDDAILSKTPEGIILTWNRGAERLLGYAEAEVVGRHVAFLAPDDRPSETQENLEKIQRGERIERFETVRLRRDGSRVDVSLTISPIYDLAGRVIGVSEIAHDITVRKRMEDELRQASEYARSLIEASLDPLVTIGLSGEITDVNEAMERMTGVPRWQLIGSNFARHFTEPELAAEVFKRVLTEGMVTDFGLTVRHASEGATDVLYNATVYRNAAGEVQGVFAAARDITRRKRAEDELARYRDQLEDLVRQRTAELEIAYQQLQEDMDARERLEAERLRLIDILEATPDMVSYSDAAGKVLYFNQASRRILGIPPGVNLADYEIPKGHPDWANRILQEVALPTAVLEGLWSGETAVLDAEGNEIPVSQVIVAHKDAAGQVAYFSTIARDMTAQKRAERELKVLASFPAENPSPVLRTTEDGLLIYANEAAGPLLAKWGRAVGDQVPAPIKKELSRALSRGKIQEAEYEAAGHVYSVLFAPMHETGHVNLYGRDITERRQVEDALVQARDELEQRVEDRTGELLQVNVALVNKIEEHARTAKALRNSQMRLAEAQRIAHLGGWEWDVRTGTLIWSDEVFRILGTSPREQAPTFAEFMESVPAEDAKRVESTAFRSIAEKKPFSLDHRIVLPNGEIRHVHAQAEVVLDSAGAARRMLGTIMDITERVRAEEEARMRQQQLIQADKMVSLGILVAGVAHEINNPNHSIMSNVSALAGVWESTRPILDRFYEDFGDFVLGGFEYSECRDKLPEMFANALSNSKRIEVIVTELRDFARHSPKENMAAVDVNAVVKSAIILMANMLKKCTDHFSATYGDELPPVLGNFQRIEQIVINLVQNACQALASRHGAVTVATSQDPASGSVWIEVCDEGVGIPEENIQQLGTPFFTTKRGSEGMGLGLWICSNIAHEHGGALTFSARAGGGTRAVLSLPANGHLAVDAPLEYGL